MCTSHTGFGAHKLTAVAKCLARSQIRVTKLKVINVQHALIEFEKKINIIIFIPFAPAMQVII